MRFFGVYHSIFLEIFKQIDYFLIFSLNRNLKRSHILKKIKIKKIQKKKNFLHLHFWKEEIEVFFLTNTILVENFQTLKLYAVDCCYYCRHHRVWGFCCQSNKVLCKMYFRLNKNRILHFCHDYLHN